MAERRMFAKSIVTSDAFLDMPTSARSLYFMFGMLADDDGFVGNPRAIARQCGAREDDLRILKIKKFVIGFPSGVVVIKHWKVNNIVRGDRYHETNYKKEKALLTFNEIGAYTLASGETDTRETDTRETDIGVTEVRLGKDSIGKDIKDKKDTRFARPSLEEVRTYCQERKNTVNPEAFLDYYEANGWKVGRNPMKDWKAAVRNWEKKSFRDKTPEKKFGDFQSKGSDDLEELQRRLTVN